MPMEGQLAPRMSERFIVPDAREIGFPIPPIPLRLKLMQSGEHWTLFIQPVPAAPWNGLTEWIAPFAPLRLEFGSRHVVRADFDPLPAAWSLFRSADLDMAHLTPDGRAVVTASGSRAALCALTRRVRGAALGASMDVRRVSVARAPPHLLTQAQDQALRAAVASGYYLVPRPLNLRDLAAKLCVSSASLSERLRRAEGRVVMRYVNEGGRSPWDAKTLFDARPLASLEHEDGVTASLQHDHTAVTHTDAPQSDIRARPMRAGLTPA